MIMALVQPLTCPWTASG